MNHYLLHYRPEFNFLNQNTDEYRWIGLGTYRYAHAKVSIYGGLKTKIPAFMVEVIFFGYGFSFYTHIRK